MISIKKLIVMFLFFLVFPSLSEATVQISTITPNGGEEGSVLEGHKMEITGSGFGNQTAKSFVLFRIGDKSLKAKIILWDAQNISLIVPVFPSVSKQSEVDVLVSTGANPPKTMTKKVQYIPFSDGIISGIILQKKQSLSDDFILNQYDKQISENDFGNRSLHAFEITKLKAAGFDEDVIAKIGKHKQYLTIGVSGIWLNETKTLVTSPMLRIFLEPKSFFDKRTPFWDRKLCFMNTDFCMPTGIFDSSKYDLNLGYTTKTSTDENGSSEKKSYLLVGFSFELNRSALLNLGWALVPEDIDGEQTQFYFGITVDYNMLKEIGILEKG